MKFPDETDFESNGRNGWENGEEITGELITVDGNTFWKGELKPLVSFPTFRASLKKKFTFQTKEERTDLYCISFNYRVHKLEDDEARLLVLAIAMGNPRTSFNLDNDLDENTEVDKWLLATTETTPNQWFARSNEIIQIGTRGGISETRSRRIDIDNIYVWKQT
ncbi:hypothetical protein SAMN04488697_111208 [Pseudomonas sp. 43mfcvi1.1]|nr:MULTISPECIES: hypothetical protein [unclassified Pseudomonas]AXP05794.1 hypothetical protein DZG01_23660 [Pseudomonas fluorescens]PWJ33112.1 hypothetical protein ATJ40_111208 [Pseudomonas sp. 43mfcvi1.1]SSB98347.1 hypothetical protein SAMN04488697_111208 [Pseudomonas sp. 43mfcvi1.1]